jgi:hypothetical protein
MADMPKMQDAIFGGRLDVSHAKKRKAAAWGCPCMPEMQEHFPAGALMARHHENERCSRLNRQAENAGAIWPPWTADMPKMQEQLSAFG